MFDLKCKRQGCKYNDCMNCSASHINVDKKTDCKTYEPSENPNKSEPDKIPHKLVRTDTKVTCHANCLFNDGVKCCANGISVQTNNNAPSCQTYMPR